MRPVHVVLTTPDPWGPNRPAAPELQLLSEGGFTTSELHFHFLFPSGRVPPRPFLDKSCNTAGPELAEAQAKVLSELPEEALVIPLGKLPSFAICGKSAVVEWRGSQLPFRKGLAIPTHSAEECSRMWAWRAFAVHDLKRAFRSASAPEWPAEKWNFRLAPSTAECLETLEHLVESGKPLAVDIETRAGHITCIGIAWSASEAISIPFVRLGFEHYFSQSDELSIILVLRTALTTCPVWGQNFHYDAQYIAKHWGFVPNFAGDTMLAHHVLFPGTPKSLDVLSSLYCEHHIYWKHEGKAHRFAPQSDLEYWSYNAKDCCKTWEIMTALQPVLESAGLMSVYRVQLDLWRPVLDMMLRGCRIDLSGRETLRQELSTAADSRTEWLTAVCGQPLNPRSPAQLHKFFIEDLGLPVQRNRKTGRPSLDYESLQKLRKKEPLVSPIIDCILELRSIGVFLSTFVQASLDSDGRMRCSFNQAGTETFRFSSSENAFGSGTNLQNIPKGGGKKTTFRLPNIRKVFVPDCGFTIFDADLAGADAQVVAWEAQDEVLMQMCRERVKLHPINAKLIFGGAAGPDGRREPYYSRAKMGVHLSNYGGTARTLAISLGITVAEAERFQRIWFGEHPGIREWHKRIEAQLTSSRCIYNAFGYRRFYFDRIEGLLPQALAWIPQSTVGCITNRALIRLDKELKSKGLQILLQVHDSLVFQLPTRLVPSILPQLPELLSVPVPYPEPLIIPWSIAYSEKSWGDCK